MAVTPSGTNYHTKAKPFTDYTKTFSVRMPFSASNSRAIPVSTITNTLGLDYRYYNPNTTSLQGSVSNLHWPGYVHVKLPQGKYHIEMAGARGGDYGSYKAYGRGARILVYYDAACDEDLVITAGGLGCDIPWSQYDTSAGPGGGASFVYSKTRRAYIAVAAGGNGAGDIGYLSRAGTSAYYGANANGYTYTDSVTGSSFLNGMPIQSYTRNGTSYAPFGDAQIYDDTASHGGAANMDRNSERLSNSKRSAIGADISSGKSAIADPVAYLLSCGDNASYPMYGSFSDIGGYVSIYRNSAPVEVMYKALIEAYNIKTIFDYLLACKPSFLIYMFYELPEEMRTDLANRMTPQILGSIEPPVSYVDFATIMGYRGTLVETLRYFRNTDTLSLFELPEEITAFKRMLEDMQRIAKI